MNDILADVETLETVLVSLTEGASDEKRMALAAIERMIERKRQEVAEFEAEFEQQMAHMEMMELKTGRF